MKTRHGWSRQAVVIVGLLLAATAAWSADSGYHKVADGVSVYFAIVPAEMVRGHPREHPESEMHGGVPAGENHIMVALFDDKTDERIVRAEVTARVRGGRAPEIEKRLESMTIAGSLTYGNYFYMAGSGPYQIELRIYAPGRNASCAGARRRSSSCSAAMRPARSRRRSTKSASARSSATHTK